MLVAGVKIVVRVNWIQTIKCCFRNDQAIVVRTHIVVIMQDVQYSVWVYSAVIKYAQVKFIRDNLFTPPLEKIHDLSLQLEDSSKMLRQQQ